MEIKKSRFFGRVRFLSIIYIPLSFILLGIGFYTFYKAWVLNSHFLWIAIPCSMLSLLGILSRNFYFDDHYLYLGNYLKRLIIPMSRITRIQKKNAEESNFGISFFMPNYSSRHFFLGHSMEHTIIIHFENNDGEIDQIEFTERSYLNPMNRFNERVHLENPELISYL